MKQRAYLCFMAQLRVSHRALVNVVTLCKVRSTVLYSEMNLPRRLVFHDLARFNLMNLCPFGASVLLCLLAGGKYQCA